MCVSSRPLRAFQISFSSSSQLKLEHLTRDDIARLVNDKLESTSAADLGRTLIDRADGAFLWVDLAVNDILRGVDNEDGLDELRARLENLPQEIGDLYLHMLQRLDTIYQDSAREFLRLMILHTDVVHYREMNLIKLALSVYDRTDAVIASGLQASDVNDLVTACRRLRTQVLIGCAGLLELHTQPFDGLRQPEHHTAAYGELIHFQENSRIEFIHASALHFLSFEEKGMNFMNSTPGLTVQAATQLFKSQLAEFRLLPCLHGRRDRGDEIYDLLLLGKKVSELGGPMICFLTRWMAFHGESVLSLQNNLSEHSK